MSRPHGMMNDIRCKLIQSVGEAIIDGNCPIEVAGRAVLAACHRLLVAAPKLDRADWLLVLSYVERDDTEDMATAKMTSEDMIDEALRRVGEKYR